MQRRLGSQVRHGGGSRTAHVLGLALVVVVGFGGARGLGVSVGLFAQVLEDFVAGLIIIIT